MSSILKRFGIKLGKKQINDEEDIEVKKNMNEIPYANKKETTFNKKAILIILLLFIVGTIFGLILSSVFVDEANDRIEHLGENPIPPIYGSFTFETQELTTSEIILPTFGVIIVCISTFLLIGAIVVYIKIALKTKSKYILGLLFFLIPFFIQSIFSVTALRSLFISSAIPFQHIRESIGFGTGGFGGILVILSVFEIIGLSILLYLSAE
jgi:biotin transporter BioY